MSYKKIVQRLSAFCLTLAKSLYDKIFGSRFQLKSLCNGKYVFLFRRSRFADWVGLDIVHGSFQWKVGSHEFKDCMFDIPKDLPRLKQACAIQFGMDDEEFNDLVFKLIKEDIVNEDSNRS